jgi:hypothetical protein
MGSCCRDSNGNILMSNDWYPWMNFGDDGLETPDGTCVAGSAKPDEPCDENCSCGSGIFNYLTSILQYIYFFMCLEYRCYRPVSGVCCIPASCYKAEYVRQQEEYWYNCSLSNECFYPP